MITLVTKAIMTVNINPGVATVVAPPYWAMPHAGGHTGIIDSVKHYINNTKIIK